MKPHPGELLFICVMTLLHVHYSGFYILKCSLVCPYIAIINMWDDDIIVVIPHTSVCTSMALYGHG